LESGYLERVSDKVLDRVLKSSGAVLIEGPKWCGKTRSAEERANSAIYIQDPDNSEAYKKAADTKPSILLEGDTPRLIDEWQTVPVLWDAVRFAVDKRRERGQFILTGSAVPRDNVVQHSGTGRIARMLMRPMSLFESMESNGTVSLKEIFNNTTDGSCISTLTIEMLAHAIIRGGWPEAVCEHGESALHHVYNYIDAVINKDVSEVDGVEKNPVRLRVLMRSLARNISTTVSLSTIQDDMATNDEVISDKTISSYINALRRIFVIEDLPAWSPAMRSKTTIRTSSKRHFVDPSIATAALRATQSSLLNDFNSFGLLFESLCIRDLRVYAQANDGVVFHYRDRNNLETDAVVQLNDGRWGAIEVKMGASEIEKAAKNLINLRDKVNVDKMMNPSFLMILTASEVGYQRKDGIYVVPIGCLRD
jgi:hypothetical protein